MRADIQVPERIKQPALLRQHIEQDKGLQALMAMDAKEAVAHVDGMKDIQSLRELVAQLVTMVQYLVKTIGVEPREGS